MSIELKIKSKHLSEEAKIIRFEERKLLKKYRYEIQAYKAAGNNSIFPSYESKAYMLYNRIKNHRTCNVRNENRAVFLARAFIDKMPYSSIEHSRKPEKEYTFWTVVFPRIVSMVERYGNSGSKLSQEVKDWINK